MGGLLVDVPAVRHAAALANIQISQDIPANTLIGNSTSVELTITNSGDTPAYNLTLALRLPVGVSVGSAAEPPTRIITETDPAGTPTGTVTVWENVVDVRPGGVLHAFYTLVHVVGTGPDQWAVGETINAPITVYVSNAEADRPTVDASGTANPVSAVVTPANAPSATAAGATTLVPLLVSKSEASPENELLRGVHDHQTVYTLSARTGTEGNVTVSTVDDWLPAGLEFLGCGTEDNSTIGEEYPGSGPLNPGNAPALSAPCTPPTLVETVLRSPPPASGPAAPLAPVGVYTHVQWTLDTTLPAGSTQYFSYVVGIPMRMNTLLWANGQPDRTTGAQGSNLDNNNGALTTQVGDGMTFTNYAQGQTEFQGQPYTVQATETVQAMDLAVYKTVSNPSVNQGEVSTWTMHIRTSEYVTANGVDIFVLRDTSPDGTCPIGSENPRCSALSNPGPSIPYSDTDYDTATGKTLLTWDLSDHLLGGNQELLVSYSTLALATYHDGVPVSAKDTWHNDVDLAAHVQTFHTPPGDNDTTVTANNDVTDDSSASQSGEGILFTKEVGHPPASGSCGNGANVIWKDDGAADLGPGDVVCFRLTGRAPPNLDVIRASFTDFLPVGFEYVDGSSGPGPANELDPSVVAPLTVTGTADTGQRLDWRLNAGATLDPSLTAQVVFAAKIAGSAPPDLGTSGDELVNQARATYENTQGEIFVEPDNGSVEFAEAHVTLTKLITGRNGIPITPGVEQLRDVVGGEAVTYTLTVTNDGTRDAHDVAVRDLLPVNEDGLTAYDATCAAITNTVPAATCSGDDLDWTVASIAAGGSVLLSYTWTLPSPEPAASSWRNEAGVVEYFSDTNQPAPNDTFRYVPRDNIDPSLEAQANTDPARDDAVISSPGVTVTKTRTTSVDEAGNNAASQATIGETISYTVTARQSHGTTIQDALLVDDLSARGQTVTTASVQAGYGSTPPGAPCPATLTPLPPYNPVTPVFPSLEVAGDVIRVHGPAGDLAADPDDLCVVLTFDAVVRDVPSGGEALNKRPNSVTNQAVVTYNVGAGEARTATATVNTEVVEPNIRITKRSNASTAVQPSQAVTYQLVVTNLSAAQVSTAHSVVVTDQLPAQVASVTDPGGGTVAGSTITWNVADLVPGGSTTLTYTVQLASPLVANQTITNAATVRVASLPPAIPGRRTSTSACSPTNCPGYIANASVTLRVAVPSMSKSTSPAVETIGGIQTYTLRVNLPAHLDYGASVMNIVDNLAASRTTYLRTLGMNCLLCSPAERDAFVAPEDNGTATSSTPRWDLAVFRESNFTRSIIIVFEARVRALPANVAGATLTNTATLTYTTGSLQATAAMQLAEPVVTLAKRVAGSVGDTTLRTTTPSTPVESRPGTTITYELTIRNTGQWTAYDVDVQDEPDVASSAGSCSATSRLTVDDIPTVPGVEVTDGVLGPNNGCLGWHIPSLFPNQTIVITYELLVPANFPRAQLTVGPEFHNHATIPQYFGLALPERVDNPDVRRYGPLAADGYANVAGGELGDRVWLDVNGDGVQDPGEPGIVGVHVDVTSTVDAALERTTVADGIWLTQNQPTPPPYWIPAGTYTIAVDTTTLPPLLGLVNTGDPDGGFDSRSQVALLENQIRLDQDFGYAGTASVGDRVWLDINGDGVQDAGEPGIPNVTLHITWAGFDGALGTSDDVDYGTRVTDASGIYSRNQLPAGPVRVTVDATTLPAGLRQTYDLNGALDNSADRTLAAGETATDVDFGYTGTASVGDLVWLDLNANAAHDPGEPGIGGIHLDITWAGFDGALGTADDVDYPTETTSDDGLYLATNLPAGDVLVAVHTPLPGGLVQTYDPDPQLDDQTVRTLTAGQTDLDADFGYTGENEIGDLVWLDRFADGLGPDSTPPDPDDPGIPGQVLTVTWSGVDGLLDTPDDVALGTATTDADGRWLIQHVPSGLLRVELTGAPATELVVTADPDGTLDGIAEPTITANDLDLDFGLAGTASLGDTVWLDINGNGVRDLFEPGIPNVTLHVEWAGFDGNFATIGDNVDFGDVVTNALGRYTLGNLPPGRFLVRVVTSTLPSGLTPTYDLDGGLDNRALRTLTVGENATDVDFGYQGTGSAGDFVWWDLNRNGVQDPGEPGLPNVAVTLHWNGFDGEAGNLDDVTATLTTDATGHYLFGGLPPGDYTITVDTATLPPGMTLTFAPDGGTDATSAFTLGLDESNLDQDFGFAGQFAIGDLVWLDINRDGIREPNEPAIAGARITVTYLGVDGVPGGGNDLSFAYVTSATTPSTTQRAEAFGGAPLPGDPTYLAIGLVDGNYSVALDPASLPAGMVPFQDLDGGNPALTAVTLAGAGNLDVDYAVFRNDPPVAPARSESALCGVVLVVNPLEGVTDPNGGPLTFVPGSVVVPPGVTVVVGPDGNLLLTAGRQVIGSYTATWQVADDAGATVTVTMNVTVSSCGALPDTGTDLQWLPGVGAGAVLLGLVVLLAARRRRRRIA